MIMQQLNSVETQVTKNRWIQEKTRKKLVKVSIAKYQCHHNTVLRGKNTVCANDNCSSWEDIGNSKHTVRKSLFYFCYNEQNARVEQENRCHLQIGFPSPFFLNACAIHLSPLPRCCFINFASTRFSHSFYSQFYFFIQQFNAGFFRLQFFFPRLSHSLALNLQVFLFTGTLVKLQARVKKIREKSAILAPHAFILSPSLSQITLPFLPLSGDRARPCERSGYFATEKCHRDSNSIISGLKCFLLHFCDLRRGKEME